VIGKLVFGMHLGDPKALAIILAAFALVPASLGVLVTVMGANYQLVTIVSNVGVFVIGAVSGAFVPLYLLPTWVERIAVISPVYWGLSAAQDVMIRGSTLQDALFPLAALLTFAIAVLVFSIVHAERSAS
jgi:ABC-2 type transport system permease protein